MKKIKTLTSCIALLTTVVSTNTLADDSKSESFKNPFFGVIDTRITSFEHEDLNAEVIRASIGAKGKYDFEPFSAIYKLDVDFAPASNSQLSESVGPESPFDSDDNFWVRSAVVLISGKYGTGVIGRGPSGNYLDVYKVLDLFKTNNWEPSSQNQNMLFDQSGYGFNVLSYATPKFAKGTLQAKITNISLSDLNDKDSDALGYRLLFTQGDFYAAISRVDIDYFENKDYHRNTLATSYKINNFYIAGLYELVENNPKIGDQDNWGVALSYKAFDTKFSVGYTERDAEIDAADDNLAVAGVRYQGFENLEFWAEAGFTDSDGNDNFSGGITLKF